LEGKVAHVELTTAARLVDRSSRGALPCLDSEHDWVIRPEPTRPPSQIRVLIADDHLLVRIGVRAYLEAYPDIVIVGAAEDGHDAARQASELRPDVVLMDLRMPRLDGIGATARIRQEVPSCEVVVLTAMVEPSWVVSAVRAGAVGFLGKNASDGELSRAIRQAIVGQVHLTPDAATMLMREIRSLEVPETLSDRELEVLRLVVRGLSNQQIADSLHLAPRTVRAHVGHLVAKLGVESRGDVPLRAIHLGLVPAQIARAS
jgi:DNA-binding NarL/FixJ family response regulator